MTTLSHRLRHLSFLVLFTSTQINVSFLSGEEIANRDLAGALTEAAKKILKVTKDESVTVGHFVSLGNPNAESSEGIAKLLEEALKTLASHSVQEHAKFEVTGSYGLFKSSTSSTRGQPVAKLVIAVSELENGDKLVEFPIEVFGPKSIAKITQPTGQIPSREQLEGQGIVSQSEIDREQRLAIGEIKKTPQFHIDGSKLSVSPQSPYQMEVLVKGVPKSLTLSPKGNPLVDFANQDIYTIKLYNNSDQPAAATVCIDGVDVFFFSEDRDSQTGKPLYTTHVIAPKSTTVIQGFHKSFSKKEYESFRITDSGKGVASEAGVKDPSLKGVIHTQFSRCRERTPGVNSKAGQETERGPTVSVNQKIADVIVDPPHEFLSVRYSAEENGK